MPTSLRVFNARACLMLLVLVPAAMRTAAFAAETDGKTVLEANCGRCHAVDANSESPLPQAPPLREVYLKYPIDQLEGGFAEGMGSRHRDMPQIQFSAEQVAAILSYLGGITGVDPASRPRVVIPGETPP